MRPPLRIRGAGTPDALPTGEYVVPIIGSHIATDKRRIERPLGQDIAYPRLHPNGEHFACQIHDGEQKDHVYEFVGVDADGKDRWIDHGKWTSVSPCLYKPDGTLVINGRDGQWGSQGLRYVTDDGVVVSADDTYGSGVYGLSEFTPIRADIVVGQTHDNNRDDAAVYIDRVLRLLEPGPCRFIRERHDGDQLAIAIWKPAANPADGEAVLFWPTIDDLRTLPPIEATPLPPVPTPPPPPDPEPEPMDYLKIITDIRKDYPTPLGARHWEFLVEVAQATQTQLFRKEQGDNILIPALGKRVNQNIIGRGSLGNRWADILGDAETLATPAFDIGPTPADGEYVDVSQVELPGDLPPLPPPPDPPTGDLEAQVRALRAEVAEIKAWMRIGAQL